MFTLRYYPEIPTLVAWAVSPITGNAPYTVTATFDKKNLIDNINYGFQVISAVNVGACNTDPLAGSVQASLTSAILSSNTGQAMANVPAGSCRTYSGIITDLATGIVVSSMMASVNNVV